MVNRDPFFQIMEIIAGHASKKDLVEPMLLGDWETARDGNTEITYTVYEGITYVLNIKHD